MHATYEEHEAAAIAVQDSGNMLAGQEGWEFWRAFGEMHHVYAFRLRDGKRVRIVGPAEKTACFSHRNETRIKA